MRSGTYRLFETLRDAKSPGKRQEAPKWPLSDPKMTVWGLDFCPPGASRTLRFGGNRDPVTGNPEIGDFDPPEMIFSPAGSILTVPRPRSGPSRTLSPDRCQLEVFFAVKRRQKRSQEKIGLFGLSSQSLIKPEMSCFEAFEAGNHTLRLSQKAV